MPTEIHKLSLGICNCYLIKDEGLILVDTGTPNQGKTFLKKLKKLSIEPNDISLILLTHGHWDHIGSANELKRLTGARVAVNHREKDWVELALKPLPPGVTVWGKIMTLISRAYVPLVRFPGTHVDLALEDKQFSLESYGIRGRVLHTPGHSPGSASLLLDSGDAFVGDLVANGLPSRFGPGLPVVAENIDAVRESWHLLLNEGAKRIYPAWGKPFPATVLEKLLRR